MSADRLTHTHTTHTHTHTHTSINVLQLVSPTGNIPVKYYCIILGGIQIILFTDLDGLPCPDYSPISVTKLPLFQFTNCCVASSREYYTLPDQFVIPIYVPEGIRPSNLILPALQLRLKSAQCNTGWVDALHGITHPLPLNGHT